jgi:PAS domain S-box-containing protein
MHNKNEFNVPAYKKKTKKAQIDSLLDDNKNLKERLYFYEKILEDTKTIVFICKVNSVKILWSSNNRYFKEMFGDHLLICLDIEDLNFINFIHPDDRNLIIQRTFYFLQKQGDVFTIIFRVKNKDGIYKWLYLKVNLCKDFNNDTEPKCICLITEFDDSFFSNEQLEALNNQYLIEKNKEIIKKLTEKELKVAKLLMEGKTHKEMQNGMKFKNTSYVKYLIKSISSKTGATNAASIVHVLSNLGIN